MSPLFFLTISWLFWVGGGIHIDYSNDFTTTILKTNGSCTTKYQLTGTKFVEVTFKKGNPNTVNVNWPSGTGSTSSSNEARFGNNQVPNYMAALKFDKTHHGAIVRSTYGFSTQFDVNTLVYSKTYEYFYENFMVVQLGKEVYLANLDEALLLDQTDTRPCQKATENCPKPKMFKDIPEHTGRLDRITKTCFGLKKFEDDLSVCMYQNNRLFISDYPIAFLSADSLISARFEDSFYPEVMVLENGTCFVLESYASQNNDQKYRFPDWDMPVDLPDVPTTIEAPCRRNGTDDYDLNDDMFGNSTNNINSEDKYFWLSYSPYALFAFTAVVITSCGFGCFCLRRPMENKMELQKMENDGYYEGVLKEMDDEILKLEKDTHTWKSACENLVNKHEKEKGADSELRLKVKADNVSLK